MPLYGSMFYRSMLSAILFICKRCFVKVFFYSDCMYVICRNEKVEKMSRHAMKQMY